MKTAYGINYLSIDKNNIKKPLGESLRIGILVLVFAIGSVLALYIVAFMLLIIGLAGGGFA